MKTPLTYLLAILGPLPILFGLLHLGIVDRVAIPILVYAFIYRPYVDSLRLLHLGSITSEVHNAWFIPFGRAWWYGVTHTRELIFGKA